MGGLADPPIMETDAQEIFSQSADAEPRKQEARIDMTTRRRCTKTVSDALWHYGKGCSVPNTGSQMKMQSHH